MLSWHYDNAEDLDKTVVDRLRQFPRRPDMLVYGLRLAAAVVMRTWLACYHRLRIVGRQNLPPSGSFVIVANHTSHLDAVCILGALPLANVHRTFPVAAKDYFFVSAPRLAVAAIFVNALPFGRQANIRQSLEVCSALLANPGNVLVIFPEGTRSPTGEMHDFKPGVGMLVAGTPLPVVPMHLTNCHAAWPKGAWFPRPRRVQVTIGKPLTFADTGRSKEAAAGIARQLHDAVAKLSAPTDPH